MHKKWLSAFCILTLDPNAEEACAVMGVNSTQDRSLIKVDGQSMFYKSIFLSLSLKKEKLNLGTNSFKFSSCVAKDTLKQSVRMWSKARKCACLFPCLYFLSWFHCLLHLLGPEEQIANLQIAKRSCFLCIHFVYAHCEESVSFSVLINKLLANITIGDQILESRVVLHWVPSVLKPKTINLFWNKYLKEWHYIMALTVCCLLFKAFLLSLCSWPKFLQQKFALFGEGIFEVKQ